MNKKLTKRLIVVCVIFAIAIIAVRQEDLSAQQPIQPQPTQQPQPQPTPTATPTPQPQITSVVFSVNFFGEPSDITVFYTQPSTSPIVQVTVNSQQIPSYDYNTQNVTLTQILTYCVDIQCSYSTISANTITLIFANGENATKTTTENYNPIS